MVQDVIVWILFAGAVLQIGLVFYRNAKPAKDAGCGSNCKGCGTVDFKKIEKQIQQQKAIRQN